MRVIGVITFVVLSITSASMQDLKSDEAEIRSIISRSNESRGPLPVLPGHVFWSGAYKAPVMGDEKPVERSGAGAPSNRVPGSQRVIATVNKIEVAKAGDMAWEYSTNRTSYEIKGSGRHEFTASSLRVWRKDGGQWKVAAQFIRPHEE
jgi:hypothetical protein